MGQTQTILDSSGHGTIIDIESHLSNSLPTITIVGFANKSVDEAKERIRGALASSGIKLPRKKITVNLAPADIPKEGSYFDLPILISILASGGIVQYTPGSQAVILGEVSLDGSVRAVRGIIGKILSAKKLGIKEFWIPQHNLDQACLVPGIELIPVSNIQDTLACLNNPETKDALRIITSNKQVSGTVSESYDLSLDDVVGQSHAKRALAIAAAGHHNIMLSGPPGTGKSMLAKAVLSIMPPLTQEETLEVTHLHSLSSRNFDAIINKRPFRSPHHSSSHTAIVGGGQSPRPGEISLSHNGVLLFDEFPEFPRSVIEALRQPIEDRVITVSRAKDTVDFPAHFLMIATANPCPCGYFGSARECSCLPNQILNYQRKLSGPILDRIDLYVDVEEVEHKDIIGKKSTNHSDSIKSTVKEARKIQANRSGKLNSELTNRDIKNTAKLSPEAKSLLDQAAGGMRLSARAYIRAIRVARTIADLEGSYSILPLHITEALQYRKRAISI